MEVWNIMNIMKLKMLLLLITLLLFLSHPALSGQGCGTNWLGSDVNDQDFYVSKNQNLGSNSGMGTPTASAANTNQPSSSSPAIKIGQSSKADSATIISSLLPDKPSPEAAGTSVSWTAASDKSNLLFKFLLKGPGTKNQLVEMTNWTSSNVWVWNTTASDIGDSQIEVRVRDGKHASPDGYDDRKAAGFTVDQPNSNDAATTSAYNDANPHPPSRTSGDSLTAKPRIAPDERNLKSAYAGNPNGPNMSMPDPSPKPLKSETSADQVAADTSTSQSDNSQIDSSAAYKPESPKSEPVDLNGKWLASLDNSKESMELILIQTGSSIMGSGSLTGETKIPLTASGSIDNDKIKLNVKTVIGKYVNQIDKHYEMDLLLSGGALSGSYQAYSGESSIGKGHVTATRPGS